ncbi:MAG: hypothetical protein IPM96_02035 [Ignavibacteria bacterium]|nr:hypothetical protein [Ignavibacteria bacterium]
MEVIADFDRNSNQSVYRDPQLINEISVLESNLLMSKKSGNTFDVLNTQKNFDALTGSVTKPGDEFPLTLIKPEESQSDNINIGLVTSTTGTKGVATCTEQVGVTAGRIWTCCCLPDRRAEPPRISSG